MSERSDTLLVTGDRIVGVNAENGSCFGPCQIPMSHLRVCGSQPGVSAAVFRHSGYAFAHRLDGHCVVSPLIVRKAQPAERPGRMKWVEPHMCADSLQSPLWFTGKDQSGRQ